MGLSGRNAMVTGGASGIGRAICLRLAREGTDVAVLDLDQAGGRQVADEVGALHRRTVAAEVGPRGITVNAIAPGLIDTPLLQRSGWPDSLTRALIAQNPIKRIGTPEDIAAACAYLVSEEASYVTGQVLSPNGGGYL